MRSAATGPADSDMPVLGLHENPTRSRTSQRRSKLRKGIFSVQSDLGVKLRTLIIAAKYVPLPRNRLDLDSVLIPLTSRNANVTDTSLRALQREQGSSGGLCGGTDRKFGALLLFTHNGEGTPRT